MIDYIFLLEKGETPGKEECLRLFDQWEHIFTTTKTKRAFFNYLYFRSEGFNRELSLKLMTLHGKKKNRLIKGMNYFRYIYNNKRINDIDLIALDTIKNQEGVLPGKIVNPEVIKKSVNTYLKNLKCKQTGKNYFLKDAYYKVSEITSILKLLFVVKDRPIKIWSKELKKQITKGHQYLIISEMTMKDLFKSISIEISDEQSDEIYLNVIKSQEQVGEKLEDINKRINVPRPTEAAIIPSSIELKVA
jgi:hypothetical protein